MNFFIILLMLFMGQGCVGSSQGRKLSQREEPPHLTKDYVQQFLKADHLPQEVLKQETVYGCVSVPMESTWRNMWAGFKFTGEVCAVTVGPNNQVSVDFLGDIMIPVKSTSTPKYRTDLFVGELPNNQVLLVQYLQDGRVISVTQTGYNQSQQVMYGQVEGDYIKECLLDMSAKKRTHKNRSCP